MFEYMVFNGERLPVALNEEENRYYYKQYILGDMNARYILIMRNLRLVFATIVKNFKYDPNNIEDLMSIGVLGLIKGIGRYDESRNSKMCTYFTGCVVYEILKFFRNENKHRNKGYRLIGLDDVATYGDGYVLLNRDVVEDLSESVEEMIINKMMSEYYRNMIYEMLFELSDRDKTIFMLSYGFIDGKLYKQEEIAEIVGVSRGAVSMVLSRGLKKMRDRLLFEENKTYNKVIKKNTR